MSDMDFRSAVVPVAMKLQVGFTRFMLHRKLGWTDIKFEFLNLDDPDMMTKMTIQSQAYQANAQTPNGLRKAMGMEPLATPWADLTMIEAIVEQATIQAQLQDQSAQSASDRQAKAQSDMMDKYGQQQQQFGSDPNNPNGGQPGGSQPGGGDQGGGTIVSSISAPKLPMTSQPPRVGGPSTPKRGVYTGKQLASMTPNMLKAAVASGLAPKKAADVKQSIGSNLLLTVSKDLRQYLDALEKEQDATREREDPKPSKEDLDIQKKLFNKGQHKQTLIERTVYNTNKDGLPKTREGQKPTTAGAGRGIETPTYLPDDPLARRSGKRKPRRSDGG
jgi:hypothetical protein